MAFPGAQIDGRMVLFEEFFMAAPVSPYQRIYLKPGELCVCREPAMVTTILGSCVSVTMLNHRKKVAAICHAVQPVCRQQFLGCPDICDDRFRYVSCVIPEMVNRMNMLGVQSVELETKLFGGSAMIGKRSFNEKRNAVGNQNIEAALSAMAYYGIRLHTVEVGGKLGRKLIFDTGSGEVLLKRIRYRSGLQYY
jgi:chemotaxis protein CheD